MEGQRNECISGKQELSQGNSELSHFLEGRCPLMIVYTTSDISYKCV